MYRTIFSRVFSGTSKELSKPLSDNIISIAENATKRAIQLLKSEYPKLYAKVVVNGHCYTVAKNDIMVCHRIKGTYLGDTVDLSQVREIGSPNYTLRGAPTINAQLYRIKATVLENGRGAKVIAKEGTQRKGRRKKVTIKPHTTLLRIQDIELIEPKE